MILKLLRKWLSPPPSKIEKSEKNYGLPAQAKIDKKWRSRYTHPDGHQIFIELEVLFDQRQKKRFFVYYVVGYTKDDARLWHDYEYDFDAAKDQAFEKFGVPQVAWVPMPPVRKKWNSTYAHPQKWEFAIEEDTSLGYYFWIYKDNETMDYTQDTLEIVKRQALEDFGVPPNSWVQEPFPP